MTIEEYSTLMGYEKTCGMEEFNTAESIYMTAGEMDKQTFCEEYKKVGASPLIMTLAENAINWRKAYKDAIARERATARYLILKADRIRQDPVGLHESSASGIEKRAYDLIGWKDSIQWKLANDIKLSEDDREYITDNLN